MRFERRVERRAQARPLDCVQPELEAVELEEPDLKVTAGAGEDLGALAEVGQHGADDLEPTRNRDECHDAERETEPQRSTEECPSASPQARGAAWGGGRYGHDRFTAHLIRW